MSRLFKFLLSFVIFVALCFFGLKWYVNSEVGKELSQAVSDQAGMTLSYSDLDVQILQHAVNLKGVDLLMPSGQHLKADRLRITAFDQRNTVPHYGAASATGLSIPVVPANLGGYAKYLNSIGVKTLTGDGAVEYSYNPDTQTLAIKTLYLDDPKLGRISLTGDLTNIDLDHFRAEQFFALKIAQAKFSFTNRAFMELLTADWARKMGLTSEVTRGKIAQELDLLADYTARAGNNQAEKCLLGLKKFMNDPGTVTVTAAPEKPVPVLYFFMGRDFYDNLELLNVGVTATAKGKNDENQGIPIQ